MRDSKNEIGILSWDCPEFEIRGKSKGGGKHLVGFSSTSRTVLVVY
jgi:hypothetical protein